MSNEEEVQRVQQQIDNALGKASGMEESLARAKQAKDLDEVQHLRTQLEQLGQLYKSRVNLQEKENLLLRAQLGGEHNPSVTTGL